MLSMDPRPLIQGSLQMAHGLLDQVIADCDASALFDPVSGSTTQTIGAIYAHAVVAEDAIVNGLILGKPTLFSAGKLEGTGVPVPSSPRMDAEWAQSIKMNLPAFREYAAAVFAATHDSVAALTDE